ncbi:hypothetical protein RJ641_031510 [Dillenia turbinata]|uniref:DUF7812 domain-containing protein n=1 Tax=Dillenia turbinata TaxID=194707 RepID=A0AAN8VY99_9MAGN
MEGLKVADLKHLYFMFLHLSPKSGCLKEFGITFEGFRSLSSCLFDQLCRRCEQLYNSEEQNVEVDELTLLLRCCMVALNLLVEDQTLLLEKCRLVLSLVTKICQVKMENQRQRQTQTQGTTTSVVRFKKSVSLECNYTEDGCLTTTISHDFFASLSFSNNFSSRLSFSCHLLEVFVDEFLIHQPLRDSLILADSASSPSEKMFVCHSGCNMVESLMEVISVHLLIFLSDENAFGYFLKRLSWVHSKDSRVPELGLSTSISLLLSPTLISAPKTLQAHLISLVSEVIGTGAGSERLSLDLRVRQLDWCLSAFERSIIFYTSQMSGLQTDSQSKDGLVSFVKTWLSGKIHQTPFKSCIRPDTMKKISHLMEKLDSSWHLHLCDSFSMEKSFLVSTAMEYIQESRCVLDEQHKEEILSVLSCITLRAACGEVSDIALYKKGDTCPQDIYLLASILKLMSCSMLQAISYMRQRENLCFQVNLSNLSSSAGYDFVLNRIEIFQKFAVSLPIQKTLANAFKRYPSKHRQSKLMLLHFAGLLSLSFATGVDFLVKNCITVLIAVVNLFIFEEGNLNALRSLCDSDAGFSPQQSLSNSQMVPKDKSSWLTVASKFIEKRALHLSNLAHHDDELEKLERKPLPSNRNDDCAGITGKAEATCNGENYLKCVLQNAHDFSELVDFVECIEGKDYSSWLQHRKRYRSWKHVKHAASKWEEKKQSWKVMGKRKKKKICVL